MYARQGLIVALLCTVIGLSVPARGLASRVLLGFGDMYASESGQVVHRGADVACGEGECILSPAAGVVTFSGRLPGSLDAGLKAVTLSVGDDLITLSPLSAVRVEKGQAIAAGADIGVASGHGDQSSAASHLHVSLRRNGAYLDPGAFIGALFVPSDTAPQTDARLAEGSVPDRSAPNLPAPAALEQSAGWSHASGALAEGVSLAPPHSQTTAARLPNACTGMSLQNVPEEAIGESGRLANGAGEIAEGVSLRPAPLEPAEDAASPAMSLRRGLDGAVHVTREAVGGCTRVLAALAARPLAMIVFLSVVFSAALLLGRRALDRRLSSESPVSDRFETLLQHARAGAKLCGLTSCSGLMPSQSRSRLAQRR